MECAPCTSLHLTLTQAPFDVIRLLADGALLHSGPHSAQSHGIVVKVGAPPTDLLLPACSFNLSNHRPVCRFGAIYQAQACGRAGRQRHSGGHYMCHGHHWLTCATHLAVTLGHTGTATRMAQQSIAASLLVLHALGMLFRCIISPLEPHSRAAYQSSVCVGPGLMQISQERTEWH